MVEPALGRVRSPGGEASLQPQVMQLLIYMAQHPREVISIDRMIEEVWAGKPMTSGSVYNALNTLRKTFGDSKDRPRYIETIPRKGYRLIAAVKFGLDEKASVVAKVAEGQNNADQREQKTGYVGRPTTFAVATITLLLVAWSVVQFFPAQENQPAPVSTPPERSIAVLPFADMSPDGDQQYLADGISEEILNLIARHPDLKVVGRSSSFQFRGAADLKQVGEALGVAHVLEGSLRREGDHLRITAQLVTTADGYHLWSESYDTEAGNLFQVQDAIAGQIAGKLQVAMRAAEIATARQFQRSPVDMEAHDLLLLARYRVNQGGADNIDQAIDYLQRVLERDPGNAPAHVEMAYALHGLARSRGSWYPDPETYGRITEHANQATSLAPGLSGAYAILGTLNYIRAWNGHDLPRTAQDAERHLSRALELNPNDARALLWSSGLNQLLGGSYLESVRLARRATELEPLLSFAAEYYLSLLSELPQHREEKWRLVEKMASGTTDWRGDREVLRATHYLEEGQLARAFELTRSPGGGDLGNPRYLRTHLWTLLQLTAFDGEVPEPDEFAWWLAGDELLMVLRPDIALKMCSQEESRLSTQNTNSCAAFGLSDARYEWTRALLERHLPAEDRQYLLQYRHTFHLPYNVEMGLATLARLEGDTGAMEFHLARIESLLDSFEGQPPAEIRSATMTRAYVHALRGEAEPAVKKLHRALDMGERQFLHFMHPAFDGIRSDAGFRGVMERWIDLINEERAQLGLPPRELNPDTGPGVLPFTVEEGELRAVSRN